MREVGKLYGIGIRDEPAYVFEAGIKIICPYYKTWQSMIVRCYSEVFHEQQPTYKECTVCNEWLTFSNFKRWMSSQDWIGNQLDKDLKVYGNKIYSPDTCLFISRDVNMFLADRKLRKKEGHVGVYYESDRNKWKALCGGLLIGRFESEIEATNAYLLKKRELANKLASKQSNKIISDAIIARYN